MAKEYLDPEKAAQLRQDLINRARAVGLNDEATLQEIESAENPKPAKKEKKK